MKLSLTLSTLLILFAGGVYADDKPLNDGSWVRITADSRTMFTDDLGNKKWGGDYINHTNIEIGVDGLIYSWTRFPFGENQEDVAFLFWHRKTDCKVPKKFVNIVSRVQLKDGSQEQYKEEEEWIFPVPGSNARHFLNFICEYSRIDEAARRSLIACMVATEVQEDFLGVTGYRDSLCWEEKRYEK